MVQRLERSFASDIPHHFISLDRFELSFYFIGCLNCEYLLYPVAQTVNLNTEKCCGTKFIFTQKACYQVGVNKKAFGKLSFTSGCAI